MKPADLDSFWRDTLEELGRLLPTRSSPNCPSRSTVSS